MMDDQTNNSISDEKEDSSEDTLKIVIDSPAKKRKPPPTPTESERIMIESIEDELEKKLEEKAAKTNLNAVHVKNIIKNIVKNEHVLNLIKNIENVDSSSTFEPKLTRSKAKELYSTLDSVQGVSKSAVPWRPPAPVSEVHALITEDLQEDSSGDEYVPGGDEGEKEDESEDDRDSSIFSDPPSVEPPTPPQLCCSDSSTQTNWTEDGVFKIPSLPKDKEDITDEATIALRTRSKLSLSSTPLEVIEEQFIPPDITTDMYEMDCDNEDWMNFLKTFTRPLDEIVKSNEEEELDPEYNVLADEETDKPDKEELRVDKAVKVSRKELNTLIAELYEFCTNEQAYLDCLEDDDGEGNTLSLSQLSESDNTKMDDSQQNSTIVNDTISIQNRTDCSEDLNTVIIKETVSVPNEPQMNSVITSIQLPLLEQQLRQHVQLLTQHFILTYQHPDLDHHSAQIKEYLLNFKYLAANKQRSLFCTTNLEHAVNMVTYWEELVNSNSDDVKKMKQYVDRVIFESIRYKETGSEYILTFPELILETISKSSVFLYPHLLPKIPFKSPRLFSSRRVSYCDAEEQLIAMGLEQFWPIASQYFRSPKTSKKKIQQLVSQYIHEYILPIKKPEEINRKILHSEYNKCATNPIKTYFQYHKAPTVIQYVTPLEYLKILPPCKRLADELPIQWRNYIYPTHTPSVALQTNTFILSSYPTVQTSTLTKSLNLQKKITFAKGVISSSTPICPRRRVRRVKKPTRNPLFRSERSNSDPITKFVKCLSKPSPISKVLGLFSLDEDDLDSYISIKKEQKYQNKRNRFDSMLPNMPSLFTPVKIDSQGSEITNSREQSANLVKKNFNIEISETGITDFSALNSNATETNTSIKIDDKPKDNPDDINALLVASSTVKPATRKEPSGAEKKRAKLKKEFLANLNMATPENPALELQKSEMFALAYYDKMREKLEIESYHKIMQILNEYEEGDAVDLYLKVEAVLRPKYKDLADELLLFLREREAAAVGRLVPWIRMNNRSKFLRKLEMYFKDQPSQLKKIYQCLTELSQTVGISMEKIKSTLVPMFKGNAVITDLFLQNFLDEPPPPSLLEGPYETIDVNKELSRTDNEGPFETIVVPDIDDKYGGSTCICSCHEIEDAEFKSRFRHCTKCGTKFVNGRVYIQTGRGLRPATVSFLTSPNAENHARLADKSLQCLFRNRKRSGGSPSKASTSTAKEKHDEDTDEDGDKKKTPKRKPPQRRNKKQKTVVDPEIKETQKKTPVSKAKKKFKSTTTRKRSNSIKKTVPTKTEQKEADKEERIEPEVPPPEVEIIKETIETEVEEHNETEVDEHNETELEEHNETELEEHNETELEEHNETELEEHNETEVEEHMELELDKKFCLKQGSNIGQQKRLQEESCEEAEHSAAGESSGEIKLGSPEQHTAESESEFCEESSQDNCESDTNSSTSSTPKSYAEVLEQNLSWRREEDKIILEVFQKENDKDHAFRVIADQLSDRTVDEIKCRFYTLMDLLMKTVDDHRD